MEEADRVKDVKLFNLSLFFMGGMLLLFILLPIFNLTGEGLLHLTTGELDPVDFLEPALISLMASIITLLINIIWGIPLGYILARKQFPGKQIIQYFIFFPVVIPPIVIGILLLMVFGPNTILGGILAGKGIIFSGTFWGIILAQTYVTAPYLVISSRGAFEKVEKRLETISLLLGKSRWETFRQITLPLARKGIIYGLLLSWIRAIGEFGATLVLAYHPHSLPIKIWVQFTGYGLKSTLPLIMGLLLLVASVLLVINVLNSLR